MAEAEIQFLVGSFILKLLLQETRVESVTGPGGVHSYRNCCFLKVVHATVASSVDTPYYAFSVVSTLILNKSTHGITKYIWLGG